MSRSVLVDLSHAVDGEGCQYPGLPAPVVSAYRSREETAGSYAPGVSFLLSRVDMATNVGTYIDSPYHRYEAGTDLAGLPLEQIAAVPGVVIRAGEMRAIGPEWFADRELANGAVLVHTGWAQHWKTPAYRQGAPFLTRAAAEALVAARVALVGIDSVNIDDIADLERPAHSLLLAAGIPIVEHLCNLDQLPPEGFLFHAVPAPIRGAASFPVRAYAVLPPTHGARPSSRDTLRRGA